MVLGRRDPTSSLSQVALQYPAKADSSKALVQDFHSFRQALNVASADQRVLMLVYADKENEPALRESLKAVANDPKIIGRFHFDFELTDVWKEPVDGESGDHGLLIINPGEFGLKGKVMKQLGLDAPTDQIINAMLEANKSFAESTAKKVYSTHVDKGRSQNVYFEGNVPYGEDRDGDGEIDRRGPSRRRR